MLCRVTMFKRWLNDPTVSEQERSRRQYVWKTHLSYTVLMAGLVLVTLLLALNGWMNLSAPIAIFVMWAIYSSGALYLYWKRSRR